MILFFVSLILIAVSVLNDELILTEILDTVFNALVLAVGIDDIKTIKNVERLKRELKASFYKNQILVCIFCFRNVAKVKLKHKKKSLMLHTNLF